MNVLLCPMSDPGYLYPAIAVGLELRRRGASVHLLGRDRTAPLLAGAGIPFLDAGTYGEQRAFMVGRWPCEAPAQYLAIQRAAREVHADVLVTSVLCHGALLAAEDLDLPVVVIGLAAYLWDYQENGGAEPAHLALRSWLTRDMVRFYDMAREQAGLPARCPGTGDYPLTGTALLLRGDPALEYQGAVLPERVHHVGPCSWEPPPHPAELGEVLGRLDQVGKPLVYVHLGRVFGGANPWPRLNAAFTGGPFQAVVELGRSRDPQPAPGADLVVVRKPWMGPLIDRAGLVLTSGTSAPVLNALSRGRALGVSPGGSEQPLLAAACVRAGVAAYIQDELDRDPAEVLRSVWRDAGLRARAEELGGRLAAADGGGRAADVIESAATGRLGAVSGAYSAGVLPPGQPATPTCPRSLMTADPPLAGPPRPVRSLGADFVAQPNTVLGRLRRTCPVTMIRTSSGEDVWVVTSERDVRAGLTDPRLRTAAAPTRPAPGGRALALSLLDFPPVYHARLRRLAASCFTPARVQVHRPIIEAIGEDLANGLPAKPQADLLADFAHPFVGRVVCETFGIAASGQARLYAGSLVLTAKPRRSDQERADAADSIEAVIQSEVGRRIDAGPDGEGILSAIVSAWRASPDRVTREELLSLCGMLLLAGFDTTAQMICMAMVAVLTHPPLRQRLRRNPDVVPDVVEELLRWDTPGPFATRRIAVEDIELGGIAIPAGSKVLLSVMAANRDPEGRPDPDILDPERAEGGRHLTFSLGPHHCLGAPLARVELAVALTVLLRRCPDLALAVPAAELPWAGSYVNRGLSALPVRPAGSHR